MSTTSDLIAQLRAMVALTNETPRIPALPRALATDAANRLDELERENARLREALEFYRDAWQWDGVSSPLEPSGDLLDDRGGRARAALEERKP